MVNKNSNCKHFWRRDANELMCLYCGRVLYLNRAKTGPRWLPPVMGSKPTGGRNQSRDTRKIRPPKWGTPE